jgi:hypothetical protein
MRQRGRTLNIEKPGADHIVGVIPQPSTKFAARLLDQ